MQLRKHLEYIKFYLARIAIKAKIKVAFSTAVGFRRKGDLSLGSRRATRGFCGEPLTVRGPHITQHIQRLFINFLWR